jgi:hypothetical protein
MARRAFLFGLAMALAVASATAQNLVSNGSFSTGDLTGWTANQWSVATNLPPGAGTVPAAGGAAWTLCSGAGCNDPVSGAILSQTLATVPGQTYTLSFYYNAASLAPADPSQLEVFWNGNLVTGGTIVNAPSNTWTVYTFSVVAASTSAVLEFTGEQSGGVGLFVTAVSVTPAMPLTPVPGTLPLAIAGLAGLALYRLFGKRLSQAAKISAARSARTPLMSNRFQLSSAATVACAALFAALPAQGQRGRTILDEQIVREATRAASGDRVELFQQGLVADPALLNLAEEALPQMEALLGRKLDERTLGHKIHIYVSTATRISHVWHGYDRSNNPRAIVFLNPRVARQAVSGIDATYIHEITHLLTWRYHSHTLSEGIADYVARALRPGAGVGPNVYGSGTPPVSADIEKYLGTTKSPPAAVEDDMEYRRAYYFASYRFVKFLIEQKGMAVFLQLYDAKNPEAEFPKLYGATRAELVRAADGERSRPSETE